MTQEFPHFFIALDWTLGYYDISIIKKEFELIGNYGYGGSNRDTVQSSYDLVLTLHDRMENEIKHTIQNCYPATQVLHLELLKSWLDDFRVKETNKDYIEYLIDKYNAELYEELLIEVEKKEIEFKSTAHYKLEHGAEYTFEKPIMRLHGWMPINTGKTETVIEKNNKFFCIDKTPEYLDIKYLNQFIARLDVLISNFRRILTKYVDLYDTGKLPVSNQVVLVQAPQEENPQKALPQPLITAPKKLKVKLSVEQLTYLFRLLKDEGLIEANDNIEIHEFISKNFETHKAGKNADISKLKIESSFSSPEKSTANSLLPILKQMWNKAAQL